MKIQIFAYSLLMIALLSYIGGVHAAGLCPQGKYNTVDGTSDNSQVCTEVSIGNCASMTGTDGDCITSTGGSNNNGTGAKFESKCGAGTYTDAIKATHTTKNNTMNAALIICKASICNIFRWGYTYQISKKNH